jgi:hypothetical protein
MDSVVAQASSDDVCGSEDVCATCYVNYRPAETGWLH